MKWIPCAGLAVMLAFAAGCDTPEPTTDEHAGAPPQAAATPPEGAANTPPQAMDEHGHPVGSHGAEAPPSGESGGGPPAKPAKVDEKSYKKLPGGLKYAILKPGTGEAVKSGQALAMNYTGWLTDGTMFDSSLNPGRPPFEVTIGTGQVIPGWDQGIPGMKKGEKRQLVIPSDMAYGPGGRPGIPPNSTLIFDVELVDIK